MKKFLIILLIVVVVGFLYAWSLYNKMVTANEGVDTQWAQVETQYQRRFDLIPNLVESVKGIMEQEKEVFANIAEARTKYGGAASVSEKAAAAGQVESALARLLVVMENYPELKSAENVQTLMVQLEGTENRISVERKRFNDLARDYNVMIKRVPAKIFASWLGFEPKNFFEAVEGSETAPAVEF
ncbi:MAG: LemA family protein [Patescibacteria group bacterium]